jgi:hypothetical protein
MWKDCPVASEEVLKIPQNNRPMCPYEAQQFEAALGAVEERMAEMPAHDALDGQFGEHVALLQVMVTRAAHALSACGFTDVVKTQKDEIGASTSQVKLPSALQAFMRLSTEYRRCVKMIEVKKLGNLHHEGQHEGENKRGEFATEHSRRAGIPYTDEGTEEKGEVEKKGRNVYHEDRDAPQACAGEGKGGERGEAEDSEIKDEPRELRQACPSAKEKEGQGEVGMSGDEHGLAGTGTDGGGEAMGALLVADACPGENGAGSGCCSGLNGKVGEKKGKVAVFTKLKELGKLEVTRRGGENVIEQFGTCTTG